LFSDPFKTIFVVGWALYFFGIYSPSAVRFRRAKIASEHTRPLDLFFDMATFIAWMVLPLIHVFSGWPDFASYALPPWAGWLGAAVFLCALLLLRSAYAALGVNWSPKIDVRAGQALVTEGIYRRIRHPIYTGMWLWVIAQPLLIQNWIAGWAMGLLFLPLYLTRVPREEAMMLEKFGERYQDYMRRTVRLIPRPGRRSR
jgi:protein-S-isoprenylcysteine O-methyltransferase Ste14